MRTGRSLTVCRSLFLGGGVSVPRGVCVCSRGGVCLGGICSGGGVCSRGVCSWGRGVWFGGCLLPGGVCSQGVVCSRGLSAPRGVSALGGVCWRGCGIPTCTEADTPPVDRITDACTNITLATTSLRPVIKWVVACYCSSKLCGMMV